MKKLIIIITLIMFLGSSSIKPNPASWRTVWDPVGIISGVFVTSTLVFLGTASLYKKAGKKDVAYKLYAGLAAVYALGIGGLMKIDISDNERI